MANIPKVLSVSVDDIAKAIGSQEVFDAQALAAKLTESAVRVLKTCDSSNGDSS